MKQSLRCVRPGGQVLFFTPALPGEKLTVDPNYLYFNDINIITSYSCGPTDTLDAYNFLENGVVRANKLVTHRFPIEKTAEAFKLTSIAENSLKALIIFDQIL
jgi:L-iditol 2-dehydrogenase